MSSEILKWIHFPSVRAQLENRFFCEYSSELSVLARHLWKCFFGKYIFRSEFYAWKPKSCAGNGQRPPTPPAESSQ